MTTFLVVDFALLVVVLGVVSYAMYFICRKLKALSERIDILLIKREGIISALAEKLMDEEDDCRQ